MLSGCNLQKTDTSELRLLGINNSIKSKYESDKVLNIPENIALMTQSMDLQSAGKDTVKTNITTEQPKESEIVPKGAEDSKEKKTEVEETKEIKIKSEEAKEKKTEVDENKETNDKSKESQETAVEKKEKGWDELAPTTHMSFEELVGDNGVYEYPTAFDVPDTYKIIVDLKYQVVLVYEKDENGEYTVPVRYMLCSTGADKSKSPIGTFEMKDYRVRFSRFVNTENFGQYWSLITGRIYFHSILYDSRNASDYITSTWNNLGKNVSHGCIRLSVPDARFIYYNMAPGTTVQIRQGSSSDKATKEIREKLLEGKAKAPSERVTLKAGDIPYTDNWYKDDIPQTVPFVQGHQ